MIEEVIDENFHLYGMHICWYMWENNFDKNAYMTFKLMFSHIFLLSFSNILTKLQINHYWKNYKQKLIVEK